MSIIIKRKSEFKLLRSHWTNGDFLWLANTKIKRDKLQACFCYFAKGIDQNTLEVFPTEEMKNGIKLILPDQLIMMLDPRIVLYLELEIFE